MTLVDNRPASRSISLSEPLAGVTAVIMGGAGTTAPSGGGLLSVKVTSRERT